MTLEQLKKTDVQLQAEARPRYTFAATFMKMKHEVHNNSFTNNLPYSCFSVALQTFAVMGVNTALIQAAVMARGKIRTIAPGKVAARADILKGNYKVEALPVELPEHIAAAILLASIQK